LQGPSHDRGCPAHGRQARRYWTGFWLRLDRAGLSRVRHARPWPCRAARPGRKVGRTSPWMYDSHWPAVTLASVHSVLKLSRILFGRGRGAPPGHDLGSQPSRRKKFFLDVLSRTMI
jgi:hypothetical protein